MFVICLHFASSKIQCLALCWRERDEPLWLWTFSGHLQLHGSSCLLHGLFPTEGKQMRCNVNSRLLIATLRDNMRPRSWEAALKPPSSPILPDEQLFGRQIVGSFLFSTADRDTTRLVHTHFWSTLPLPLSSQTERKVRLRFISFSAG